MFHSDDERNRNVDPYNESHHSYASTTRTTTTDKRNATCTFELGQFTLSDFDTLGLGFDSDFGGGDSYIFPESTINSATFNMAEHQYSATFLPEDMWPI
jgi:hypothetical protein